MNKQAIYDRHCAIAAECHRRAVEASGAERVTWTVDLTDTKVDESRARESEVSCETPEKTERYNVAHDAAHGSFASEIAALQQACGLAGGHVSLFWDKSCTVCGHNA